LMTEKIILEPLLGDWQVLMPASRAGIHEICVPRNQVRAFRASLVTTCRSSSLENSTTPSTRISTVGRTMANSMMLWRWSRGPSRKPDSYFHLNRLSFFIAEEALRTIWPLGGKNGQSMGFRNFHV
jgi:hypothetical protein